MLLSEIIDEIMLRTGQFVAGDISNLNISVNQFWSMMRKSLAFYNKHKPISKKYIITTDSNSNYVFPVGEAPEFINKATPTGFGYVNPFTISAYGSDSTSIPIVVFRYDKPRLYTSMGGEFEIEANFNRTVNIVYTDNTNTTIQDIDFPEITDADVYLFDLIEGTFLQTIGKFRRAFNLADNPIVMDFDMMVQEGTQKIEDAKESIIETNSWWLGIGQ